MRSSKAPEAILVGHGSKTPGFDAPMKRTARALRAAGWKVRLAYLEVNSPSIPEAVASAVGEGAREVRILPYFILKGKHVVKDIPGIVREARVRHGRSVRIRLCPYLGYDERIVEVVRRRLGRS